MDVLELVLFAGVGILFGIISGLLPGLHVNTMAAFLIAVLPALSGFSAISIAAALVSMAVVNSFLSFIPSILLGAPDSENVLSVLPGHRMLLNGEAIEAIKITAFGGIIGLIAVIITFQVSIAAIPSLTGILHGNMHYVLLLITLFGIMLEDRPAYAAGIFVLSGIFGFITLNSFEDGIVFPALSGMFGISTMILSLNQEIKIPAQDKLKVTLGKISIIKNSLIGAFAGAVVGFLPGIGAAQATFLVQQANNKQSEKEFLVSNSAVSVANTIFPLFVLFAIGKTRSGIAIATKEVLGIIRFEGLLVLMGVAILAGVFAYLMHIKIGIFFTNLLINKNRQNYGKLTIAMIIFLTISVFALTGINGVLVLGLGTLIGLLPPLLGVRRAECMGYFVLPTMLYYAGLSGVILKLIY